MSLYIELVRRVIADAKATLDTIDQRQADYTRIEGLVARLNTLTGVTAAASADRYGGALEVMAQGDKTVVRQAIEDTGHVVIHPGGHCWATIQPPASAGQFAMVFTLRIAE